MVMKTAQQTNLIAAHRQDISQCTAHANHAGVAATCLPFLAPAHKSRRVAHVWRVRALRCGRRITLQLSDTSQRNPKFAQILPSQMVPNLHSRFTPRPLVLLHGQHVHAGASPNRITRRWATDHKASGPTAAKSYTNPASRSCCRIHIRKLHPSRYIGSRFGGFFLLSDER